MFKLRIYVPVYYFKKLRKLKEYYSNCETKA